MPVGVECQGADTTARALQAMGARALNQSHTFETEGRAAQRSIGGIPVRTGRLERGVRGGPESILHVGRAGYTIATTVPYARFVFGGTKSMPARPPRVPRNLGPAAAQSVGRDVTHR